MSRGKQINCAYCDREKLVKNEIGLNKKFIHPKIERMMCFTCMAKHFEMSEEELKEIVEKFRREGCLLFE